MPDTLVIVAVALGALGVGVSIGVLVALWMVGGSRRALGRVLGGATPGAVAGRVPVNTEVSAQRAITADSIERGADEIQANAKYQGIHISRADAREQAGKMLAMLDPLGGAR